jgi:phosphatidate cytidylyltransferase
LNELVKRIIVAFVGIPLALLIIYLGEYPFLITIIAVSSFALWEFYKIAEKKHAFPNKIPGIVAGLILTFLFYFRNKFNDFDWLIIFLVIFIIIILILELFRNKPNGLLNISTTLAGVVYVSVSFCCLVGLRDFYKLFEYFLVTGNGARLEQDLIFSTLFKSTNCAWLVAIIFISVWLSDSAAYFIGVKWGKHKLFPRISPKKSWEGAFAGFVFAIIGFGLSSFLLIPKFPMAHAIIIGAIIGIIGQVGDLAESLLKRDAGIKDSSGIIPGHGGVLDRFDSILFVAPAVYIYLIILLFIN